MGSLRLAAHCFGYLKNSFFPEKEEKCPLNPTTKKRRRLRPLVNLLRRPNSRKMLERRLQERRKKCKPREPLIRKRKQGVGKMDTCKKKFKCDRRLDISLDRWQKYQSHRPKRRTREFCNKNVYSN